MSELYEKECIPCRGGVLPFDISNVHKYLKKVDGWDVRKNKDNSFFIEKEFKFKNLNADINSSSIKEVFFEVQKETATKLKFLKSFNINHKATS